MGLGSVLSGVLGVFQTALTFTIEYAKQVYEITKQAVSYMIDYVQMMFSNFPADNSKRTLWLAIIFFFVVIAITIIFNSNNWFTEGLGATKGYSINGDNQIANNRINNTNSQYTNSTTGTTLIEVLPAGNCVTDNDCDSLSEGQGFNIKCCYPNVYVNNSCSGHCQKPQYEDLYSIDACKHPNSCYYIPYNQEGWLTHAKYVGGRCDINQDGSVKGNPNEFCRQSTGLFNSVCCNSLSSICYGYCLTNPSLACDNENACPYENLISVQPLSGGEI